MDPDEQTVKLNVAKELFKVNEVNEFEIDQLDITSKKVTFDISLKEIQDFYEWLVLDLYRREKPLTFTQNKENEKKFYIVPLRLQSDNNDELCYVLDIKLIKKVCSLKTLGYKD